MSQARQLVHATAISVDGRAALIVGPSGSGKSDLALRLVMTSFHDAGQPIHATLIADDQVIVERRGGILIASCPTSIAGRMEVRGLGIVPMPHVDGVEVHLVADIDPAHAPVRLPDEAEQHYSLLGLGVPLLRLDARQASAPAKLVLALLRRPSA